MKTRRSTYFYKFQEKITILRNKGDHPTKPRQLTNLCITELDQDLSFIELSQVPSIFCSLILDTTQNN